MTEVSEVDHDAAHDTAQVAMHEDHTGAPPAAPPGPPTFVEPEAVEADVTTLFAGDTGVLPYQARRALALVLQRRYLSAAGHPAEWKALLAHQGVLASRCHDLFVELVVDRDYEIAYKRQVREAGLSIPVLLKDEPYKRIETLLMLFARNRFRQEQGVGERAAYVDAEELVDYALGFLAQDETNLAGRRREIDNAVASLVREHVLDEVAQGRYRVEPVVEILLPVERLRELTAWLRDPSPSGPGSPHTTDRAGEADEADETHDADDGSDAVDEDEEATA
ncbi:DUF4194 domain-containing protein [Isoptericola sp. NEAU-Y5]|uniref:DUF4194 domain-containing protein n=1 Tax=Isoptericola luteus TaxID=2879484 RepID=A0ABS7ZH37_9MICO|nr:DUF4194 domain-containing protein [Isoptericola sp. NEAU-Y5]MCA5893757.1 DUF4194 domain-containing protein [Isoptericola sp. NEAU-Y5]